MTIKELIKELQKYDETKLIEIGQGPFIFSINGVEEYETSIILEIDSE